MHFHSMSHIQQYMHMYVVIACNGPKLHMCAYTDNTAMNTDLMVTRFRNARFTAQMCFDYVLELCNTYLNSNVALT